MPRLGISQMFYMCKILNFLDFTRENRVNHDNDIFGENLRMGDVLIIFARLVTLVTISKSANANVIFFGKCLLPSDVVNKVTAIA